MPIFLELQEVFHALDRHVYESRHNVTPYAARVFALAGKKFVVPVIPKIDRAILDAISKDGLLEMTKWHTCKTTHCRAGWAIHLAGRRGRLLEKRYGSAVAGALIYYASAGYVPDFYATNWEAIEDIRQHAEEDAQNGGSYPS